MYKASKSALAAQALDQTIIDRANRWSAFIQLAPKEVHHVICSTFEEAAAKAREFNKLSKFGRRALVYAINPEDQSTPVSY